MVVTEFIRRWKIYLRLWKEIFFGNMDKSKQAEGGGSDIFQKRCENLPGCSDEMENYKGKFTRTLDVHMAR